jgi:inosine-uridine nucleoside N-ribohydrolase
MPITYVGWELSADECGVTRSELEMLRSCGDGGAEFVYEVTRALTKHVLKTYGRDEAFLPDAVAAAVAIDPTFSSKLQKVYADVEAKDDEKYGWLEFRTDKEPNSYVAHKLDSVRFKKDLFKCLKREEI